MKQIDTSFFSQMKERFFSLFEGDWLSSLDVIRMGICFGVSFLIGLIFKKSFKYIILYSVSLIIVLSALNYFNIISVDVAKVKMMLGLAEINDWSQMTQYIAQQMKAHVYEVTISTVGIILGFKVG